VVGTWIGTCVVRYPSTRCTRREGARPSIDHSSFVPAIAFIKFAIKRALWRNSARAMSKSQRSARAVQHQRDAARLRATPISQGRTGCATGYAKGRGSRIVGGVRFRFYRISSGESVEEGQARRGSGACAGIVSTCRVFRHRRKKNGQR
jgi:hypothetical protein